MFLSGVLFVLFLAVAIAWMIARKQSRPATAVDRLLASEAFARHPASRARQADPRYRPRPIGPDDDPEFLRALDRYISGTPDSTELSIPRQVVT